MDIQSVQKILYQIPDPNLGFALGETEGVKCIAISGDNINITFDLGELSPTVKSHFLQYCHQQLSTLDSKLNFHFHFEQEKSRNAKRLFAKNIIAVGSGKGGVGKSTVSVNLALGLSRKGAKVGIMDADLYGPSIPTMLGLQGKKPKMTDLYGVPKIVPIDFEGIPVISIGFMLEPEQAVVLRGPRLSAIIKQFFNDILWPSLDFLIVDLPPGTGDIQLSLVQTVPLTGAVIVTTPQEVAVADAIKAINMFLMPQIDIPILGVVENMSWFTPAELPESKYLLFGEGGGKKLAKLGDTVLLGQVPLVMEIREAGDGGYARSILNKNTENPYFDQITEKLLVQLAWRHEMLAPSKQVHTDF